MKPFWQSKTFWVNLIGVGAAVSGVVPEPETVIAALGLVNLVLRAVTKQPITWKLR
jgi:hypothetical protein